jgi:hypothetical protein
MASDFTREELEEAFRQDPKYGMECLYLFFRDEIAGYIKCVGQGYVRDAHELQDIFQNVMVDMIEASKKPTFDPHEPMRLVYRIAFTNTKEYLRKKGVRNLVGLDECLEHLAVDFKGTDLELRWKYLDADEQKRFNNVLFDIICDLPEMQQYTALVFVSRYKQVRDETDLFTSIAEGVRELTGKDMTAAAAKGNWYRARTKIAHDLRDRGFDLYQPE